MHFKKFAFVSAFAAKCFTQLHFYQKEEAEDTKTSTLKLAEKNLMFHPCCEFCQNGTTGIKKMFVESKLSVFDHFANDKNNCQNKVT